MGLLDSVIGALAGGRGMGQAGTGGLGGLGGLGGRGGLGGGGGGIQAALLTALLGMLANRAGQGGGSGGLGGLIGKFNKGGMGDVMSSWIGRGQNAAISGDQLSSVLGADTIDQFAAQAGVSHEEAADQLSQMLPEVVDRLTPDGNPPAGDFGDVGDILAQLSRR